MSADRAENARGKGAPGADRAEPESAESETAGANLASSRLSGTAPPRERRRFSLLTVRILAVNILALALLVGGLLFLGEYRTSLIQAELDALRVQGEVVAAALGEGAVVTDTMGEQILRIDVARALIRRLAEPTLNRARLFNTDGHLIGDTNFEEWLGGFVQAEELPPLGDHWMDAFLDRIYRRIARQFTANLNLPLYVEYADQRARDYPEVLVALRGDIGVGVRATRAHNIILTVAVPVQRYKEVVGAIMLSENAAEIESALKEVRFAILKVFGVALTVTILMSLYLAGSIVRPIRHLARAAQNVRRGYGRQREIPDYSRRGDEIGELSADLRAMTEALWQRMDAIERFAADVAHEIKNPLSSLRSAVETVARLTDPARRAQLMAIILEDVQRLDRLISDISNASRVDAELSRTQFARVDLAGLLSALVEIYAAQRPSNVQSGGAPEIRLKLSAAAPVDVSGVDSRLVQVFRNLIDNAMSFSPPGGRIDIEISRADGMAAVTVDDEGPGLPEGKQAMVFERFYTERPPGEKFGTHSGLGLSIAKQIVEVHGGTIIAENRRGEAGAVLGSRFTVRLPRRRTPQDSPKR